MLTGVIGLGHSGYPIAVWFRGVEVETMFIEPA